MMYEVLVEKIYLPNVSVFHVFNDTMIGIFCLCQKVEVAISRENKIFSFLFSLFLFDVRCVQRANYNRLW